MIKEYLRVFPNLQTVGRAEMHCYNNMDHSMITGILSARNLDGGENIIWDVNEDDDYQETSEEACEPGVWSQLTFSKNYKNILVSTIVLS